MARAISFGYFGPTGSERARGPAFVSALQRSLGVARGAFTSVWFSDHFMDDGAYVREAWVMLGYAAALAPELQLGHLVLCNSYRAKWSQSTETLVGYHARESPDAR